MKYLVDTHIILWWLSEDARLSTRVKKILTRAMHEEICYASDISLWEVSMLIAQGRVDSDRPTEEFLEFAFSPPIINLIRISPRIAAEVVNISPDLHGDPADRLIVATARIHQLTLITYDKKIIASKLASTLQ